MRSVDINKSGEIDYSEFVMATINRKRLLTKQNLESTFKLFDIDGNGSISLEELKNSFKMIETEEDVWEEIIREVDKNGDGQICIREFMELFSKNSD